MTFLFLRHLKRREEEESMRVVEEAMKHDSTDEDVKRKFYISKIRSWINIALDDLGYLHGTYPRGIFHSANDSFFFF